MTECNQTFFPFEVHFSRQVVAQFEGSWLTTEGGSLLLRQVDRKIDSLWRVARCFSDYLMLKEAFDGRPPICVSRNKGTSVIFIASNNPSLSLPQSLSRMTGLTDATETYADPRLRVDLATDDWPFFYMPKCVYPVSYLVMVTLVVLLSTVLVGAFSDAPP